MLTTTHGYEKPETADAPSALRTAIGFNADKLNERLGMGGSSIIATDEQATTTSFALLTTPDRVQSLVIPAGGAFIDVTYSARWGARTADTAWTTGGTWPTPVAAIFVNSAQLLALTDARGDAPVQQATIPDQGATFGAANPPQYWPLSTAPHGLQSVPASGGALPATGVAALPTTARALAHIPAAGSPAAPQTGSCRIYCPTPGTYDVDVRFRMSLVTASNRVSVKDRVLLVRVLPFAS